MTRCDSHGFSSTSPVASCPYCDIDRLKTQIDYADNEVNECNSYIARLQSNNKHMRDALDKIIEYCTCHNGIKDLEFSVMEEALDAIDEKRDTKESKQWKRN